MFDLYEIIIVGAACVFAFICGLILVKIGLGYREKAKRTDTLHKMVGITDEVWSARFVCEGLAKKILQYAVKISYSLTYSTKKTRLTGRFVRSDALPAKIAKLALMSNMPVVFGNFAYRETQFRICFLSGCIGLVVGMIFSTMLAILLCVAGVVLGMLSVSWAMKQEKKERENLLEKNLPEMLEVLSLGLRSGLTFDRSFALYCQHFSHSFSSECSATLKKWEGGIKNRDEALRDLANAYDLQLFKRVVESIIRSLRFGSSLVEGLEDAAVEARQAYRAKQEEIVAKAPVKMMIPTGTLILPAMLLLVLGPVLLELIGGF